jgi:hypothetical protein
LFTDGVCPIITGLGFFGTDAEPAGVVHMAGIDERHHHRHVLIIDEREFLCA